MKPAVSVRGTEGSNAGHSTLGISVLPLAWATRCLDGLSGLAAKTWRLSAACLELAFKRCFGIQIKVSAMVVTPLWIIDERYNQKPHSRHKRAVS